MYSILMLSLLYLFDYLLLISSEINLSDDIKQYITE